MLIIAKYCQADKSKILLRCYKRAMVEDLTPSGGIQLAVRVVLKLGGTGLQVQLSSIPRYNLEAKLPPAWFAMSP